MRRLQNACDKVRSPDAKNFAKYWIELHDDRLFGVANAERLPTTEFWLYSKKMQTAFFESVEFVVLPFLETVMEAEASEVNAVLPFNSMAPLLRTYKNGFATTDMRSGFTDVITSTYFRTLQDAKSHFRELQTQDKFTGMYSSYYLRHCHLLAHFRPFDASEAEGPSAATKKELSKAGTALSALSVFIEDHLRPSHGDSDSDSEAAAAAAAAGPGQGRSTPSTTDTTALPSSSSSSYSSSPFR